MGVALVVADVDVDHGGAGRLARLGRGDELVEGDRERGDVGLAGLRPGGGDGDHGVRHAGDPPTPAHLAAGHSAHHPRNV